MTGYQLLHQGTAVDTSNRLNHLFHGRAGVRASAAFTLGLMTISILLMKPRLPPKRCDGSLLINFQAFIREPTYVLTSFRSILSRPYVCSDVKVNELFLRVDRNIFFLQLYAVGINLRLLFIRLPLILKMFTYALGQLTILDGGPNSANLGHKEVWRDMLPVVIICVLAVKAVVGVIPFRIHIWILQQISISIRF